MATAPLTDSGLRKIISDAEKNHLIGESTRTSIADGRGLALKRLPSGTWAWWFRYRFNGKSNTLSLGAYPFTTLAVARVKRDEAKGLLKLGINPSAQRDEIRAAAKREAANSFKAVALSWYENWRIGKGIDEKHAKKTLQRLENDVFPAVGNQPIHSLTLRRLSPIFKSIEERAPSLAEKAWVACGQVFRYACAHGIIDRNPLADIKRGDLLHDRHIVENQKRVSPKEIPALLRDIDRYDGIQARLGLQLMSLVFVRHAELCGAEWSEFDFEAGTWTIPAHRMKKVRGGATPHIVPLSTQALVIIEQLRTINGGRKHLFPSTKGEGKVMSDNTMNKALHLLGYKDRQTVHGFRGLASTALHEMGFQHEHIELQLAHIERNKVSAAYNHATYLPQRTIMMQHWANFLDEQRGMGQIIKIA
mgnify:CR=1 FL=1